MTILVIDIGSTSLRAGVVDREGTLSVLSRKRVPLSTPMQGFVEIDPAALARAAIDAATEALSACPGVEAIGITNQRGTTVLWERSSGVAVAPAIGWQDLRTVASCLLLQSRGIRLAPNESATKLSFLLDVADPDRSRDLCFGTIDSWIAWNLSSATLHVTDTSNAGITGLLRLDGSDWDADLLSALAIPSSCLPQLVDSSCLLGEAKALPGSPPIAGIGGDQQCSLLGQGCSVPGATKATFGTGGMLDMFLGTKRPAMQRWGEAGTYPVVTWRRNKELAWGIEAIMLSAGSAVDWLVEDLGILASAESSQEVAASASGSGDVLFVPALDGLGTPVWDFGARGLLVGLTGGTTAPDVVQAVLVGLAHRGADLLEAAEADSGMQVSSLRVDGGLSSNDFFLQALADASQKAIEVSPVSDATSLGAAYLAGLAVGTWADEEELRSLWSPHKTLEPGRPLDRERWLEARDRCTQTVPELSTLRF